VDRILALLGADGMDMYGDQFSAESVLSEQVARQIFGLLGDVCPLVIIMDMAGHCRPSDTERFAELGVSESYLSELRSKIDDGYEPVITELDGCAIVAGQLSSERTDFGYVVLAFEQCGPEATLGGIDLVELVLNQFNLIATLIEKNNSLIELQTKQMSGYGGQVQQTN
jgi:hypothetical protein